MAANVAQHERSNIKCYASTFSNILIWGEHGVVTQLSFISLFDYPLLTWDLTHVCYLQCLTNKKWVKINLEKENMCLVTRIRFGISNFIHFQIIGAFFLLLLLLAR